jgi:hypothetical protein
MPNVTIVYSESFGNPAHLEEARVSIQKIIAEALNDDPNEQPRPDWVNVDIIRCNQPHPIDNCALSYCSITITAVKTKSRQERRRTIWEDIAAKIREIPSLKDNGHFAGGSGHNRSARTLLTLLLNEGFEDTIPLFYEQR